MLWCKRCATYRDEVVRLVAPCGCDVYVCTFCTDGGYDVTGRWLTRYSGGHEKQHGRPTTRGVVPCGTPLAPRERDPKAQPPKSNGMVRAECS